jgi:hypothetical protein
MLAVTTFHLALYSGLQLMHSYYSKWHNGFEGPSYQLMTALLLAIMVTLLHVLDRQIEFTSRTDFLWKAKLKVEQEEVETMRGINKILLENILPAHVAEHFLDKRNTQVQSCKSLGIYLARHKFTISTEMYMKRIAPFFNIFPMRNHYKSYGYYSDMT